MTVLGIDCGLGGAVNAVTFEVAGKPSAWQRAQKVGKRHFTLPAMAAAQHAIAAAAHSHIALPLGPAYDGALSIDVLAVFAIPKSRARKISAGHPHTQKPDGSNIGKQVEDALNGIAYRDDAQVSDTRCRKVWGEDNKTIITLVALYGAVAA